MIFLAHQFIRLRHFAGIEDPLHAEEAWNDSVRNVGLLYESCPEFIPSDDVAVQLDGTLQMPEKALIHSQAILRRQLLFKNQARQLLVPVGFCTLLNDRSVRADALHHGKYLIVEETPVRVGVKDLKQ